MANNNDPNTKPPPTNSFALTETQHTVIETRLSDNQIITVDYEAYAHLLDDPDLSEDQKRELLQALWNIITSFVDLGFGVHPVQLAKNSCGESPKNHAENTISTDNALESKDTDIRDQFTGFAKGSATKGGAV